MKIQDTRKTNSIVWILHEQHYFTGENIHVSNIILTSENIHVNNIISTSENIQDKQIFKKKLTVSWIASVWLPFKTNDFEQQNISCVNLNMWNKTFQNSTHNLTPTKVCNINGKAHID